VGTRTLTDLADAAALKSAWKAVRSGLTKIRLQEFTLAHDPLEWLAYDFHSQQNLQNLASNLQAYAYRPTTPDVIRGAKSVGLTRPIAYLQVDDAITYVALVRLTENDLLSRSFEWSKFGRSHKSKSKKKDDESLGAQDYSWFVQWMKRQGQVWDIVTHSPWIVETDISNFFGTLDLDSLMSYVRTHGCLDETLNNLLRVKLGEYAPLNDYRPNRRRSLPQETLDVSRILAHTYLRQLDEYFEDAGNAKRFSRWVDDVVMGADSWSEALQLVRRFQVALETLNLYPNTAKTRIIPAAQFAEDYDQSENDYLGRVEQQIEAAGLPTHPDRFRKRVQTHARRQSSRRPSWDRVLRRYYTVCKRIHDDSLLPWWDRHIPEAPKSAAHILEYVATFRLTASRLQDYKEMLHKLGGVYTDIELLCREAVLTSPNVRTPSLWDGLGDWGLATLSKSKVISPNVASSAALIVAKFGTQSQIESMKADLDDIHHVDNVCRSQLAAILFARGVLSEEDLRELLHVADRDASQAIRFLLLVSAGNSDAVSMLRFRAQPIDRKSPERAMFKPRLLVLLPLLRRVDPKWSTVSQAWLRKARKFGVSQYDAATIAFLEGKEAR
jgi:hypothetical protein